MSLALNSSILPFTEPPKFDNTLPDVYRLLDSLEEEGGDLSERRKPPSLFTRPEHSMTYQKISGTKH